MKRAPHPKQHRKSDMDDQREDLNAAGGILGKPLARCMGGSFCHHLPGECTADPAYQAEIAATRPEVPVEEIVGTLTAILEWYKTLNPRARQSLSLSDLHSLSKALRP